MRDEGNSPRSALLNIVLNIGMLLAFVACATYFALNAQLLGGQACTRVLSQVSVDQGWTTMDGTPVDLRRLNDIAGFGEHGASICRRLDEPLEKGMELNFLSKNATVHLLYDGVEVYSYDPDPSVFGAPYGDHFNFAPITPEDQGKLATLVLRPVHADSASVLLDMRLLGTTAYIQRYVRNHLVAFLLSLTIVFVGLGMISLDIAMRNVEHGDLDLLSLGGLAMLLGTWSAAETLVPQLVTGMVPLITALDYLALLFAPYPMVRFTGSLVHPPHRRGFDCVALGTFVLALGATVVLAATRGLSMHQLLPLSHSQLMVGAAIIVAEIALSLRTHRRGAFSGPRATNRFIMLGFLLFVGCSVLDFVLYNVSAHAISDTAFFIRLGLFCFITILASMAFRTSISNMKRAHRVEVIEQIAYIDALTGIGNRTAWHEMCDELQVALANGMVDDVMVCQFDVNFLKMVNDTLGHAAGDEYIRRVASTINRSFGTEGSCYRTGGDEFTAVIAGISLNERLKLCKYLMSMSVDEQSGEDEDVPLSIASGFACVSETSERTLEAAQKLADERMYANKRAMKCERE